MFKYRMPNFDVAPTSQTRQLRRKVQDVGCSSPYFDLMGRNPINADAKIWPDISP
jgi:hypothetical protein